MSKELSIEVRCLHCGKWFRSPIGFGSIKSYDTSILIGNIVKCPNCGRMTDCNKENMRLIPKAFISFSNTDRDLAKKITNRLIESNIQMVFDEYELRIEDSLIDQIKDTLTASNYILILISSNSINSKWINEEINSKKIQEFRTRDITTVPVLIEDCEIPSPLNSFSIVDLNKDFESGLKKLIDKLDLFSKIDFSLLDFKSFEDLIYSLLKELKFINIIRDYKVANQAVDFKAEYRHKDPFGNVVTETWIIETKFYENKRIDSSAVVKIISYLSIFPLNTKGVLITTGHVSSIITDFLNNLEKKIRDNILIIDRVQLKNLLVDKKELISKFFQ